LKSAQSTSSYVVLAESLFQTMGAAMENEQDKNAV